MENYEDWLAQGKAVTERLLVDIRLASASWAHFEAINGETEESCAEFRRAVNKLGHSRTIDGLMRIFLRDTLMALFRMSDDPGTDRLTLLTASKLLRDPQAVEKRMESVRGQFEDWRATEMDSLKHKIDTITDCVPQKWKDTSSLKSSVLNNFRSELRPLRDTLLAHARYTNRMVHPQVNDIRSWLKLSDELASACHHIFKDAPISNMLETYLPEQNLFWDYAARGFVATASQTSMMPDLLERITINPEMCGGRPCIRSMRVCVSDILEILAAGASRAEILSSYPYLEDEDITAALAYAARNAA